MRASAWIAAGILLVGSAADEWRRTAAAATGPFVQSDQKVGISELITGVNNSLSGCD